jgi:quercetin dioxygenase-like cupin family protein
MTAATAKRTALFFASEARALGPETMSTTVPGEALRPVLAQLAEAGVRPGIGEQNLVLFSEPGETGLSLVYVWFKSHYLLPPHSHNCDCLYYVLQGELHIGSRVLHKGDGLFVPAGHVYSYEAGPDGVEVLEFRNATRFDITLSERSPERWERILGIFRERAPLWRQETTPPSQRNRS